MEQTLGKRIVQQRKQLGLTQDQLAEKLGVTAQAVSKWENDQSCPDIAMLPKLAEIFGSTTDALLGNAPMVPVYQAEAEDTRSGGSKTENHWEFTWNSGRKGALGYALLVLAVGVQLVIAKLTQQELSFWNALWPAALLIFGLTQLTGKFSFVSFGCVLFGGYFVLNTWNLLPFTLGGELVFPIILVVFGISLLVDAFKKPRKPHFEVHHNGKKENDYRVDGETFTYSSSFSEARQLISLPRLSMGRISTSFGEHVVDLSGVRSVSEDCRLDISCSFGELTLLVPRQFEIRQTSSTTFAEIEDHGQPDPNPTGIIYTEASASFGEITIRYI